MTAWFLVVSQWRSVVQVRSSSLWRLCPDLNPQTVHWVHRVHRETLVLHIHINTHENPPLQLFQYRGALVWTNETLRPYLTGCSFYSNLLDFSVLSGWKDTDGELWREKARKKKKKKKRKKPTMLLWSLHVGWFQWRGFTPITTHLILIIIPWRNKQKKNTITYWFSLSHRLKHIFNIYALKWRIFSSLALT